MGESKLKLLCYNKEYEPKRHESPEETRELAIKMYYGGVSDRGVGKILGMNKSNEMNWIKKALRTEKFETI